MKAIQIFLLCSLVIVGPHAAFARSPEPKIEDLSWASQQFMIEQRLIVDKLSRRHFGTPLRNNKTDLPTIQRIIDKEIIARNDKRSLQALGVVLGDVFVSEIKALEWKVLEDKVGRSHVVCVKDSSHCLFPITMLSRRIEVGLNPNAQKTYNKALNEIKAYLPKLPFQD